MYRKRNGSLGFSFTKFAEAAVPNFFEDTTMSTTNRLYPLRKDMLHNHQIASANFCLLDKHSCYVAGIVDTEKLSKSAFQSMQKHGILDADGMVDTTKITNRFTHQVAMLNAARQRDLINMLFWWEEECQRFCKLRDEDKELGTLIEEAEQEATDDKENDLKKERLDQIKFARERVRMKIRQVPSQRRPDTEANTDNIMEQFRGKPMSVPMLTGGHDPPVTVNNEQPPEYGTVGAR